jgi:hypothetical protein
MIHMTTLTIVTPYTVYATDKYASVSDAVDQLAPRYIQGRPWTTKVTVLTDGSTSVRFISSRGNEVKTTGFRVITGGTRTSRTLNNEDFAELQTAHRRHVRRVAVSN